MQTEISRRAFCGASLALALSPSLSFVGIQAPGPDDKILNAVAEWLRLEPVLTDLEHRRVAAFDASRALVGECPMGNYEANRAWHDAWDLTECGRLEWEWDRLARISDEHMTTAVNTPAVTADGIAAKLTLYRASVQYFGEEDDYMMERIEADLAALSGLEA